MDERISGESQESYEKLKFVFKGIESLSFLSQCGLGALLLQWYIDLGDQGAFFVALSKGRNEVHQELMGSWVHGIGHQMDER